MKVRQLTVPRLATRAGVVLAAAALVATAAAPANAQGFGAEDRSADTGHEALLEALQRDLGLTAGEVDALLEAQTEAIEVEADLEEELGASFGGSWFDHESGTLTVATTEPADAGLVESAGAESTVVSYAEVDLEAITAELDEQFEAEPESLDGVVAWAVDVATNQVLVTVAEGAAGTVSDLVDAHGDAVRIEETDITPELTNHPWLDGGIPYGIIGVVPNPLCSTGFNLRNAGTGVGFVLTAGHCIDVGQVATSDGVTIGPAVASFFPTFDDALIRNDNPGSWFQGPWVWTYPGFITVGGSADPPVGTAICKSGMNTGVTCGVTTVKNETVNFGGQVVNSLTRHTACVQGGDSGGSNYTSAGILAVGTTTGAQLIGGLCLQNFGQQNVSWYFPTTVSLPFYQSAFGATLIT